jgi:hypothetical protein
MAQNPPTDPETFTAAVLLAEGLDLRTVERQLYRGVLEFVAAAFERSGNSWGRLPLERGNAFGSNAP